MILFSILIDLAMFIIGFHYGKAALACHFFNANRINEEEREYYSSIESLKEFLLDV